MKDYHALRIERLERIVLAMGRGLQNGKPEKGIAYYMVGQDDDTQASDEEVNTLLDEMQKDMERTAHTGQI